jgi:hypothetical protein
MPLLPTPAAQPHQILQGLQNLQPQLLFPNLTATVAPFIPYMLVLAAMILTVGHVQEQKEVRRHHHHHESYEDLWVKTILVFGFMITSGWWLTGFAVVGDGIGDVMGVGSPIDTTNRCFITAYSLPDFIDLKTTAAPSGPGLTTAGPAVAKADDGTTMGTVKAFFAALGETAVWYGKAIRDTALNIANMAVLASQLLSTALKFLVLIPCLMVVYLALIMGGLIAWAMDALRYFLLVLGSALLPIAVACYRCNSLRNQGNNYCLHMVGLCLWPMGWALGNIGTVALFDAWVGLMSGSSTTSYWAKWAQAMNSSQVYTSGMTFKTAANAAATSAQMWQMFTNFSTYEIVVFVVGACGLFIWILTATLMTPILIHKLVTAGSAFYSGLAQGSGQTGGKAVEAVGKTVEAAGVATGQPEVVAAGRVVSAGGSSLGSVAGGEAGGLFSGGGNMAQSVGSSMGESRNQREQQQRQRDEQDILKGILTAMQQR